MRLRTVLFVLAGLLRLAFHLVVRPLGWDASVYVGMAKAVVTAGQGGLWEPLRPMVWPLLLAPFALTSFILVWAHLLQLILGMGVVLLVYLLARDAFGERAALWALGFVALSPLLAFYEHQLLSELPSVFLVLLAVYLVRRGVWGSFTAGIFVSLAFLTKFPQGIVVVALCGLLLVERHWKRLVAFGCGFGLVLFPFLLLNALLYQNPVAAVVAANDVIKTSGLWLYGQPLWFYAVALVVQCLFFTFAIPGAVLAIRKQRAVLCVFLFVFVYWSLLPHKEIRFLPLMLPFAAMLAGAGWSLVHEWLLRKNRHIALMLTVVLIAIAGVQAVIATQQYWYAEGFIDVERDSLFAGAAAGRHVVSSDPRIVFFTDQKIVPLYYPLFPQNLSLGLAALAGQNSLLFNSCDTPCGPDDAACQKNLGEFESIVRKSWVLQKELVRGGCNIEWFTS